MTLAIQINGLKTEVKLQIKRVGGKTELLPQNTEHAEGSRKIGGITESVLVCGFGYTA